MYAVVEFNGKQYRAEKGALLKVDRFDAGDLFNCDDLQVP